METLTQADSRPTATDSRPRLGFLGVGGIGRARLAALAASGEAEVMALADPDDDALAQALGAAPGAEAAADLDALLGLGLDGVVIATPNALHAEQTIRSLEAGLAVFCQKPLARTAAEARRVVDAARAADRLLGVDLSYRHVDGVPALRADLLAGEIGDVFAADVTFHNAYGPGKPWALAVETAGGGCVLDLGVHMVDLALWMLGGPDVEAVESRLWAGGEPLALPPERVEDYAVAALTVGASRASAAGTTVRLACSWNVSAGQEAVIEARFYGTAGGAVVRNVGGSFHDLTVERTHGPARWTLARDDAWGGGAAVTWARALGQGAGFDAAADQLVTLHAALDRIYGRDPS